MLGFFGVKSLCWALDIYYLQLGSVMGYLDLKPTTLGRVIKTQERLIYGSKTFSLIVDPKKKKVLRYCGMS